MLSSAIGLAPGTVITAFQRVCSDSSKRAFFAARGSGVGSGAVLVVAPSPPRCVWPWVIFRIQAGVLSPIKEHH